MVEFCWGMFPLFMKDRAIGIIARTVVNNIATATIIIDIGRIIHHLTRRHNNKIITIWRSKSSFDVSTVVENNKRGGNKKKHVI